MERGLRSKFSFTPLFIIVLSESESKIESQLRSCLRLCLRLNFPFRCFQYSNCVAQANFYSNLLSTNSILSLRVCARECKKLCENCENWQQHCMRPLAGHLYSLSEGCSLLRELRRVTVVQTKAIYIVVL